MKRILFVFISLFVVYLAWPEPESSELLEADEDEQEIVIEDETEADLEPITRQKAQPMPQPSPMAANTQSVPIQRTKISSGRRLPPGIVEFELLSGNWAVTHGDILLGKLETQIDGTRGQFKPKKSLLWESPDIPYAFGSGFSKERIQVINLTMEQFSSVTAVNFYLADPENLPDDYILFIPSDERCASYLGRIGGQQPIFLKDNCGPKEIRHEAMHALGFVHEQSRKDRDQYVKINWDNIKEGHENQFDISPDVYLENYRGFVFNFDYESVMLYSPQHFTKSPELKTIETLTNKEIAPSQTSLSESDIQRVNYLYGQ